MDRVIFDYEAASANLRIPVNVMRDLEEQARMEFPDDAMLMELHMLRALKACARETRKGIAQ